MGRVIAAVLLLTLPAVAHAKGMGSISGDTIGQIVVALLIGGGGGGGLLWYRRNQAATDGREQMSTRAQVAIARDKEQAVLQRQVDNFKREVEELRKQQSVMARAAATQVDNFNRMCAEVNSLGDDLVQLRSRLQREQDHRRLIDELMGALGGVEGRLQQTLQDIHRYGGGHGS